MSPRTEFPTVSHPSDTETTVAAVAAAITSSAMQPHSSYLSMHTSNAHDHGYMVDYNNIAHIPISLEGTLPLAHAASHVVANNYAVSAAAMNSPIASSFPSVCTPQPPMTPQLALSAAAAAANAYASGQLTPMTTPTVPSISSQVSPTHPSFPEFHEYSRRHYEMSTDPEARKRARMSQNTPEEENVHVLSMRTTPSDPHPSEQKRRAQIKDGFEHLREQIPSCNGSKKHTNLTLLAELERLSAENDRLRKRLGDESPSFSLIPKPYPNIM
ncbi:hypothetical protein BDF22DRAFT_742066 [Syncephalis plumigaleata]|nr:hypothetical protein BDF22DRAFT_742066 [Syncephalis plumigaleata]